jgi:hypothetical protein
MFCDAEIEVLNVVPNNVVFQKSHYCFLKAFECLLLLFQHCASKNIRPQVEFLLEIKLQDTARQWNISVVFLT